MFMKRHAPLIVALSMFACPPPAYKHTSAPGKPTSCANLSGTDNTIYDISAIKEKPTPRVVAILRYPPEAERQHIHGRVVVSTVVNSDGTLDQSSIVVVESVHPLLDAEAKRFVSESRLWPACRSGQPVRVRMNVPVVFDRP
jgi:TonB family protein